MRWLANGLLFTGGAAIAVLTGWWLDRNDKTSARREARRARRTWR